MVQAIRGCNRVQPLLDSYISNELLVETNYEILRHLGECEECVSILNGRTEARHLLRRAASTVTAPPELEVRVRRSLRGVTAISRRTRPNWHMLAAIAAGLAVLAVAGLGDFGSDPALRLGWGNHMYCTLAGHSLEHTPTEEVMAAKLGAEYGDLLDVVRTRMTDYRLRQAHRCITEGHKFAHLTLQKEAVLMSVSVLVRPGGMSLPQRRGMRASVMQGVEVAGFEAGNYLVFISSNQDRAGNLRAAAMLEPAIRETLRTRSAGLLRR
ncbi:MAG: zf-HC2 domain-containing protein [Bryobacteraceae bacterium]|nr:zf-HC2 domain-containing protein [Bryobacteraceae bacterium]